MAHKVTSQTKCTRMQEMRKLNCILFQIVKNIRQICLGYIRTHRIQPETETERTRVQKPKGVGVPPTSHIMLVLCPYQLLKVAIVPLKILTMLKPLFYQIQLTCSCDMT